MDFMELPVADEILSKSISIVSEKYFKELFESSITEHQKGRHRKYSGKVIDIDNTNDFAPPFTSKKKLVQEI